MTQDSGSGAPMSERMQSLLSRAVEDQLSEQRQLASALADLRAQLGQLGGQLNALQGGGSPPHLDEALGAIASNVREAVRLLGERLDGVARLVQERGHDLAEQRAMIAELKAAVDRHTNALDGMTSGLAALPAFGERIDVLQGGLGGLADRLHGLEQLTAAVGAMQQRSDALDSGLRELRQAFAGVAARAAQLPGRDDLEGFSSRVAESVDGLGGRLSRLETSVPSLLERLDALADAHESSKSALQDIADRVTTQPSAGPSVDVDSAEVGALREELADMREHLQAAGSGDELAALADRLDAVHDGLFGADGVAERLRSLETTGGEETAAGVDADAVAAIVANAVAASERRLADHVDEAILTLAEALLRRRARQRPSGLGGLLGAGEVESVSADDDDGVTTPEDLRDDEVAEDEAPADEDEDADEDGDEHEEYDEDLDSDGSVDDADETSGEDDDRPRPLGTPWQTPSPADQGAAAETGGGAAPGPTDAPKKRKPWWRPGG